MHLRFSAALSALTLVGDCSGVPSITYQDEIEVIRKTADISVSKFGSPSCIVTQLRKSNLSFPGSHSLDSDWVQEGKIKYRKLGVSKLSRIPSSVLKGFSTTATDFGCSTTVRFEKPEFSEIEENGNRVLNAFVDVDRLCGPICGEEYSLALTKEGGSWQADSSGLRPTGQAY